MRFNIDIFKIYLGVSGRYGQTPCMSQTLGIFSVIKSSKKTVMSFHFSYRPIDMTNTIFNGFKKEARLGSDDFRFVQLCYSIL